MYLNGWHPTVMNDKLEGDTTTMQVLLNQTDFYVANIERNYNTETAGQWVLVVPVTDRSKINDYVNNVLIPATIALKSYADSMFINDNFKDGLTISRFSKPPIKTDNKHLASIRSKTAIQIPATT
jgi:hypothetical protein